MGFASFLKFGQQKSAPEKALSLFAAVWPQLFMLLFYHRKISHSANFCVSRKNFWGNPPNWPSFS